MLEFCIFLFLRLSVKFTNQISICRILLDTGVQLLFAYHENYVEIWLVVLFWLRKQFHAKQIFVLTGFMKLSPVPLSSNLPFFSFFFFPLFYQRSVHGMCNATWAVSSVQESHRTTCLAQCHRGRPIMTKRLTKRLYFMSPQINEGQTGRDGKPLLLGWLIIIEYFQVTCQEHSLWKTFTQVSAWVFKNMPVFCTFSCWDLLLLLFYYSLF